MTMCVNFVKIRLVVFDFYAEGHSQVSHLPVRLIKQIIHPSDDDPQEYSFQVFWAARTLSCLFTFSFRKLYTSTKMIVFSFRVRVYNGRISNQEFVQSFLVCHGKSSVPETCAWVIFCNILRGFIFIVLDLNTTKPWAGSGNVRQAEEIIIQF